MLFRSTYLIPLPSSGSRDIGALPPWHGGAWNKPNRYIRGMGYGSSLRAGLSRDLIVPLAAAARNWRALLCQVPSAPPARGNDGAFPSKKCRLDTPITPLPSRAYA
jgi:hypothetical protein